MAFPPVTGIRSRTRRLSIPTLPGGRRFAAELKRLRCDPPFRPFEEDRAMKLLTMTLTAALLASPAVHAACTTDEVNAKADELAKRVNQLTESNPERAKEINEEIRQMDAKRSADQLGNECEAYDKRLQQIEQAERE